MAKTKQVAVVAEEPARELSKTIVIDGNTYNINAKTVEKTNHPLVINQITLGDPVPMTFDGSSDQTINIVSAEGGRFTGKIAVPSATAADFEADKQMVVNYNDIKNIVLDQFMNNSVLSTWDGDKLEMGGESASIKSVGIVTGKNDEVNAFAEYNFTKKIFAAFIYVADNGLIYFGNADSKNVTVVELSAKNAVHADEADQADHADKADIADKLATARTIRTNLGSTSTASFDGSANITPGVTGTLPVLNGGTGQTDLSKVSVGHANSATSADAAQKDSADHYIVDYYQPKILTGTVDPNTSTVTAVKNAPNGAIYIKY